MYGVFAYSGLKIVFIVRAIHDVLCFNYLFPCLNLGIMNVVTTIQQALFIILKQHFLETSHFQHIVRKEKSEAGVLKRLALQRKTGLLKQNFFL